VAAEASPFDPHKLAKLVADARVAGNVHRGAEIFRSAQYACLSCHRVHGSGGIVGPDLSSLGVCQKPEYIAESLLWPNRQVRPEFAAVAIALQDGRVVQGIPQSESDDALVIVEATTGKAITLKKAEIQERRSVGSLMPDGLQAAMSPVQRRDLVRFLSELGREGGPVLDATARHEPTRFEFSNEPLYPQDWPNRAHPVNRDRLYDFYAKEADHFRTGPAAMLLPEFPGLDGGSFGHWGNQMNKPGRTGAGTRPIWVLCWREFSGPLA
jgi:putative heme-binding domain-containing protein